MQSLFIQKQKVSNWDSWVRFDLPKVGRTIVNIMMKDVHLCVRKGAEQGL